MHTVQSPVIWEARVLIVTSPKGIQPILDVLRHGEQIVFLWTILSLLFYSIIIYKSAHELEQELYLAL